MINDYWYAKQLKNYIIQFCAVFSGLNVVTGLGEDNTSKMYSVPIVFGSKDRVVAAIMAGNTQNKPFSIPMMSANMAGLELAPERKKGTGTVDRKVYLPSGGIFPDDLRVVHRIMPIPYNMQLELTLYASNTDQLHQMLEQILLLFDPILQIQLSDAPFDWTKITDIELTGINNEENYPPGNDKRIINWSLNFVMPIYLSAPMDLRDNIVRDINIRLGNLNTIQFGVVDEEGSIVPFTEIWGPPIHISESDL